MLKDCTNCGKPPVLKTFQRRAKQPSASEMGAAPVLTGQHDGEGLTKKDAQEASSSTYTFSSSYADSSHEKQPAGCPGGLLKSLWDRRTSVILPLAAALNAAKQRAKRTNDRRQQAHSLAVKALVAQLIAQSAEIDAFELTVEDPGPSPEPERRRRGSENRSRRRDAAAADGARVPTVRAATRPARPPAASANVPTASAGAVSAPSAAGRNVSGGGSAEVGAPRRAAAPAPSTNGLLTPPSSLRASLDLALARDVRRLGIGAGATSSAAGDAAAAAARCSAASSDDGATGSWDQGHTAAKLGRREGTAGRDSGSLDSRRDSAAQPRSRTDSADADVEAATGSRGGGRRPSALPSPEPSGGSAASRCTSPASPQPQQPGPSGEAPRRSGLRASVSHGGAAAAALPPSAQAPSPSPSVATSGGYSLRVRPSRPPSLPRSSVGGRAADEQWRVAEAAQQQQQEEEKRSEMGVEQHDTEEEEEGTEVEEQEERKEQVEQLQQQQPQEGGEFDEEEGAARQDAEAEAHQQQWQWQDVHQQQDRESEEQEEEEEDEVQRAHQRQEVAAPEGNEEAAVAIPSGVHRSAGKRLTGSLAAGGGRSSLASLTPLQSCGAPSDFRLRASSVAAVEAAAATGLEPESWGLAASPSAAFAGDGLAADALAVVEAQAEVPAEEAMAEAEVLAEAAEAEALTPLQRLLQCCGQKPSLESHELPTMDDVIDALLTAANDAAAGGDGVTTEVAAASAAKGGRGRGRKAGGAGKAAAPKRPPLVKVGEGSYGEAWCLGGGGGKGGGSGSSGSLVIKVVPIEGTMIFNDGPQKTAPDMLSETILSRHLSALADGQPPDSGGGGGGGGGGSSPPADWTAGFVRMHAVAVCRGPYSKDLVKAWEKWDKQYGSENEPVSQLPADQLYWVIAMEDGGTDLEKFVLESWDQLRSVLLQTALGLAVAESSLRFEHRDLHWGNVLVRPAEERADCGPDGWLGARLQGRDLRVASCGLAVTIIDFTASRLEAPDGSVAFCDLSQDPAVFEGTQGEVQFDTYRWMRELVEDDWSSSCPATNCLWLSYLAEALCARFGGGGGKGGGSRALRLNAAQKRQLRDFRKRAVAYRGCSELVRDELFRGLIEG